MLSAEMFFTFNRRFLPAKYNSIAAEDAINILALQNVPFIDDIQKIIEKYQCTQEQSTVNIFTHGDTIRKTYILDTANPSVVELLKEIYFFFWKEYELFKEGVKDNPTFLSEQEYRDAIYNIIRGLEWILFYYTDVIVISHMIQKLDVEHFLDEAHKENWIEMCKAWGNKSSKDFRLIFNINTTRKEEDNDS